MKKTKKDWEVQLWKDLKIRFYLYQTVRLDNNKRYKVSPFFFASEEVKEDRLLNTLAYASGAQDIEIKKEFLQETQFLLEVIDITDKKLLYHLNKTFNNTQEDKEFITKYLKQIYNQGDKINWKFDIALLRNKEFLEECLRINNQNFNLYLFKEYVRTKPNDEEIISYAKNYPYLIHIVPSRIKKHFFNQEKEVFFKYMETNYDSYEKLPIELKLNLEIISKTLHDSSLHALEIPKEITTLENIKAWYKDGYPLESIPLEYFKDKDLIEKILINGERMKFFLKKKIVEVYENTDYLKLSFKTYPHLDLLEKCVDINIRNELINDVLENQKNAEFGATDLAKQWYLLKEWNADKEKIIKFIKNNKFSMDVLSIVVPHIDENVSDLCDYIKTDGYVYIHAKRNKKEWSVIKTYLEFWSPDVSGKDRFLPKEIIDEFIRHDINLNIAEMLNYANYKLLNKQLFKKEDGKKLKI